MEYHIFNRFIDIHICVLYILFTRFSCVKYGYSNEIMPEVYVFVCCG